VQKGVLYNDITRIKIPVFVYEMCRQNINDIFTQKPTIEFVSSTDRALEELDEKTCAVASSINKEKHPDLVMGQQSIADSTAVGTKFGYLTCDATVSKDAKTTLLVVSCKNTKGCISSVADAFYCVDIIIKSFRTYSVSESQITMFLELETNARSKAFKEAITQLEADIDQVALNVDSIDDDRDDVERDNGTDKQNIVKSKIKILGCF